MAALRRGCLAAWVMLTLLPGGLTDEAPRLMGLAQLMRDDAWRPFLLHVRTPRAPGGEHACMQGP